MSTAWFVMHSRATRNCRCSCWATAPGACSRACTPSDRKSTRLNSSHLVISYAVFCLKKKKQQHSRKHLTSDADLCIKKNEAAEQTQTKGAIKEWFCFIECSEKFPNGPFILRDYRDAQ